MNRALLVVCGLLLAASPALAQIDYHYSLSGSDTDPFVNQEAPIGGLREVWLWLYANCEDGVAALEFDVVVSSEFVNLVFVPVGNVLNAGNQDQVLLAVGGCPSGPFALGYFLVLELSAAGGTMCMVPSAANGWNVSVDCDPIAPTTHDNGSYGYSTDGSIPCGELTSCVLAVEETSWGRVKSLFR